MHFIVLELVTIGLFNFYTIRLFLTTSVVSRLRKCLGTFHTNYALEKVELSHQTVHLFGAATRSVNLIKGPV